MQITETNVVKRDSFNEQRQMMWIETDVVIIKINAVVKGDNCCNNRDKCCNEERQLL